jgi:hypothetical protein
MTSSVLVAFAAVLLMGAGGFVFAWIALTPVEPVAKARQLERTLERIEHDVQHARELLGVRE